MTFDADSHAEESAQTWKHLDKKSCPTTTELEDQPAPLGQNSFYVICEEDEDLREPLKLLGEDRIMLGSDMPHSESHPNSLQKFQERSDLSAAIKPKILNDNARQFLSRWSRCRLTKNALITGACMWLIRSS